jgi:hypothetical protein
VEGIPTIIFQMLRERSKLGYTIGLSVQEKYILPVKTLARLDEGEVMLPDLARLDDTVFGIALQLQSTVSMMLLYSIYFRGVMYVSELLPVDAIDLQVGVPKLGLDSLGRSGLEVAKQHALAGVAEPSSSQHFLFAGGAQR